MNKHQMLFCFMPVLAASCIKQPGSSNPSYPKVTTIVEGRITRKYTNTPVAGTSVTLQGHKPFESTGFCLFCPDSTTYDIASTITDNNGFYHLEGTTQENLSSAIVWTDANSYGFWVTKGTSNYGVNFTGVEYIILKEHFHVINNNVPLLSVGVPISYSIGINAMDTNFIRYGASMDTGVNVFNYYRYTNNGVERYKGEYFHIGAFADTLTFSFTVDPSTF